MSVCPAGNLSPAWASCERSGYRFFKEVREAIEGSSLQNRVELRPAERSEHLSTASGSHCLEQERHLVIRALARRSMIF